MDWSPRQNARKSRQWAVYVVAVSTPPDPGLSAALRISVMRLSRRMRQERNDVGLSATHVAALATLERHGPLPLGELAALEKVAPPSMTRVVTRLTDLELVARSSRPGDKRQVLVTITDHGRELLAADRRRRNEWLSARLTRTARRRSRRALAGHPGARSAGRRLISTPPGTGAGIRFLEVAFSAVPYM